MQNKKEIENQSAKTENEKYFLAMSHLCTHKPIVKSRLFEYFNFDIKKTFECEEKDLKFAAESFEDLAIPRNFLQERDKIDPDKIFSEIKDRGQKFITFYSPNYPFLLKNIPDFPLMLYYNGNFDNINFKRAVAFVGSRKATIAAKEATASIIAKFKGLDITVISGLAEGIDTVSHKSAFDNGIKTVAVIGSGLDYKYPVSNKKLYSDIENSGGVIFSEYPCSMPPAPYLFPLRNRIVTGIASGTVVGEAKLKSGAMISANLTLEQGRELMCIPGNVLNPNTEGIYRLLKDGASLVTRAEDILEVLGWEIEPNKANLPGMNEFEHKIYNEIALEPKNIEDLSNIFNVPVSDLMVNLTSMELKGLIKLVGGNYFISGYK